MSIKGHGSRAASGQASPSSRAQDGREPALNDDHEPPAYQAFVFENAVVVAKRGHTRIEHPERGTTYAEPLPPQTRRAAREVAYYG